MKKVLFAAMIAAVFTCSAMFAADQCCGGSPTVRSMKRETNTTSLPPIPVADPNADPNDGGVAYATDLPPAPSSRTPAQDGAHDWTPPAARTCCRADKCCPDFPLVNAITRQLARPLVGVEAVLVQAEGKRLRNSACRLNIESLELADEADKIESLKAEGCCTARRACALASKVKEHECAQAKLACDCAKWTEKCERLQRHKSALNSCCE